MVRPDLAKQFAHAHDARLWRCLCAIVKAEKTSVTHLKDATPLPLGMGGLELRSAVRMIQCNLGELGKLVTNGQGTPP